MKHGLPIVLLILTILMGCRPDVIDTDTPEEIQDPTRGSVEFNFSLPDLDLPDRALHRLDLSLALTADSLYRKQYVSAANVSDMKQTYTFVLKARRYYYQAAILCTAKGDSCLYAGFPGGYLSSWWAMGWVDIEAGKHLAKNIIFQ